MNDSSIPKQKVDTVKHDFDNNRYKGQTKNGVRSGNGTYGYPIGGKELFTYAGEWKDGYKQGQGSFKIAGFSKYEGEFSNGEITGYGKRTWADGRIYEGNFICGEQNGHGRWTHHTTNLLGRRINLTYEGEFVDNRRQGQGMYDDGAVIYTGAFSGHKFNGMGNARARDGSFTLNGVFLDNILTGAASVNFADQEQRPISHLQCDTWRFGRPEGFGTYACTDNSYYFSGNFAGGSVLETEVASYIWSSVDRSELIKAEEAAAEAKLIAAGGKAAKKAPPKKGEAPEGLTVPRGCNIGEIIVRTGGQALIEAQAAAAAAAAADPKAKKGKDAPSDGGKLLLPEPPAGMPMPAEHRRLFKVTLRSVLAPTPGGGLASLSEPLPLWVRNPKQEEMASMSTRFPVPAIVFGTDSTLDANADSVARRRPPSCSQRGAPSALRLENGASKASADSQGVVCNLLPINASVSYSVSFDNWSGAQSRITLIVDFKLDSAIASNFCAASADRPGSEYEVSEQTYEYIPIISFSREFNGAEIDSSALRLLLVIPRGHLEATGNAVNDTWTNCKFELRSAGDSENPEEAVCATWDVPALHIAQWHSAALDLRATSDEGVLLFCDGTQLTRITEEKLGSALAWLPEKSAITSTSNQVSADHQGLAEAKESEAAGVIAASGSIRHIVRFGGAGFAGSIKALALCTASEACNCIAVTSVYDQWHQREATWAEYKSNDWYGRAVKISAHEKAAAQSKADKLSAAQLALAAAEAEAAAAKLTEDAATMQAAQNALSAAQAQAKTASADASAPVKPTLVTDVPYDYKIESAAWITLVCGQVQFNNLAVPVDLPPGQYTLQIEDAVTSSCLLTKNIVTTTKDDIASSTPLPLASVQDMIRAVRPVATYTQLSFLVTDPKAEP